MYALIIAGVHQMFDQLKSFGQKCQKTELSVFGDE